MLDTSGKGSTAIGGMMPGTARIAQPALLRNGRILVLEPKPIMAGALQEILRGHGYEVRTADTCAGGVRWLTDLRPDLIIADLALPDLRNAELCRHLRACSQAGILVTTPVDDEDVCAEALHAGADDYVVRPFRMKELVARVAALLRRVKGPSGDVIAAGDIGIDLQTRVVTIAGRPMRLRPHEFDLLLHLTRHPSTVHSYRTLLATIWGGSIQLRPHYVRMCVAHLRRQIEPTPDRPRYLLTERGIGYRLEPCG
jgi:two-component system, OmpR family, KDP operon response regulator KdpE